MITLLRRIIKSIHSCFYACFYTCGHDFGFIKMHGSAALAAAHKRFRPASDIGNTPLPRTTIRFLGESVFLLCICWLQAAPLCSTCFLSAEALKNRSFTGFGVSRREIGIVERNVTRISRSGCDEKQLLYILLKKEKTFP